MNVGDSIPPRQVRHTPCPKCGDKVFKTFPTGFVIESCRVVNKIPDGFTVADSWHCPACGVWETKLRRIAPSGVSLPRRVVDSSDKSKRKRSIRR
jgi:predicted RNA-binding Zn-ribbon protein involved in translation (DUF1610 family)